MPVTGRPACQRSESAGPRCRTSLIRVGVRLLSARDGLLVSRSALLIAKMPGQHLAGLLLPTGGTTLGYSACISVLPPLEEHLLFLRCLEPES